jgi:hypothetical protein
MNWATTAGKWVLMPNSFFKNKSGEESGTETLDMRRNIGTILMWGNG